MSHEIVKCERCAKVIRQCRCPAENKTIKYEFCKECDVPFDGVFQGPKIIWQITEIKKMVDFFGKEEAINRITQGIFDRAFVAKQVEMLLETNVDLVNNVIRKFDGEL